MTQEEDAGVPGESGQVIPIGWMSDDQNVKLCPGNELDERFSPSFED
jgi:hypothetical protein